MKIETELQVFNFLSPHGPNNRRKAIKDSRTIARIIKSGHIIITVGENERYCWMVQKLLRGRNSLDMRIIDEPGKYFPEHKWLLY